MIYTFKTSSIKYSLVLLALLVNFFVSNVNANNINKEISAIELKLNVRIGVAIYDVKANELRSYNGNSSFPLMSTFKTLTCAKLLADVDKGE